MNQSATSPAPPVIALAGNPNSGKTTLFNCLTGSRQHVGNWPGVTVEKKEGRFKHRNVEVRVVDLPGTYSLSAYSLDERIARDFMLKGEPTHVVAVIDASNLERNLYLVAQLLELEINVILDLNMMDLLRNQGIRLDTAKLSRVLGLPVLATVAHKGIGINELRDLAISSPPVRQTPFQIDYGLDVEQAVQQLSHELTEYDLPSEYPRRWLLIKLLEGDDEVVQRIQQLPQSKEILNLVRAHIARLEKHLGYDLETALIERRYGYLKGLVEECSTRTFSFEDRLTLSDKIDRVVTNRVIGIPLFFVLLWLTFQLVFSVGAPAADGIDRFFGWTQLHVSQLLGQAGAPAWISSLLADGIIGGVGSVLVFLPNILLLFLAIALLENSGYMARAAFVMDKLMHTLGLHGKSFIPLILGFGCSIPGIMAARTLESRKDRIITILVTPLVSCSARLPIYVLFAGIFFPRHQGIVIFSLYLMGIVLAVGVARVFKSLFFPHEIAPLIMELPPYRLPQARSVLIHMWERASLFVKKAGGIILVGVVIIWFLSSFPFEAGYASPESLIGRFGSWISPTLAPAGFGFWQAAVALSFGILAKEIVVGTLGTLYGTAGIGLRASLAHAFTPLSAYAFMTMSLIYVPCIATIATIKKEIGWRWAALAAGYSIGLGWLAATVIYQVGRLFL